MPTPGPIPIEGADFDFLKPNRISGWTWDAYVNYLPGGNYDPDNSYAEPTFDDADDPIRRINGSTLKVETIKWLKFRTWVHQTVSVTVGTTVQFSIKASAFSSLDRLKVKAGIDQGVKEFEAMSDFKPDAPFDHVFGTDHEIIERQRADFLENLKVEAENA